MHMMAAAATAPSTRRRKFIGHRRRVEDDGEEDGGHDALDLDDDSLTEGSIGSDDNDPADGSDTSNIDEASPTPLNAAKPATAATGNGVVKPPQQPRNSQAAADVVVPSGGAPEAVKPATVTDTDIMLNGLSLSDQTGPAQEMNFDDVQKSPPVKDSAPIIVSSASAPQPQPRGPLNERRRREHEEYRRKRDEDPAFVPNRGAFFMHDHRHAGPAANGFRPFPRGGARGGRGRGGFGGGLYTPIQQFHQTSDPTTNAPWAHDMHEAVAEPLPSRPIRHVQDSEGPPNGNGIIPTCPQNPTPINRTMSTEKHLGNVQIRVFFPPMKAPVTFPGQAVKQYTKLPDHRPPLRRDKPVRISLPDAPPRYIFPAMDRSFIFIPRAMRPNQQRLRGKGPRSAMGSIGGFSRRTSVFGGSYYGSAYSPSIAQSRRSSLAPEMGRDYLLSPTGSAISRPPLPMDSGRPVVRLPPLAQPHQVAPMPMPIPVQDMGYAAGVQRPLAGGESSITDLPQPQTHPLPQKPAFQENRPNSIPMHQPRPQKTVSVENIESPAQSLNAPQPYQQAFHQQYPLQVSNGFQHESHARNPSYASQRGPGTPLSQIPERAIHAAPFQPNAYQPQQQQQGFYNQPYQMMQQPQSQGYYYGQPYGGNVAPNTLTGQGTGYAQPAQGDPAAAAAQANGQAGPAPNLVAQEVNGMVYYYDASQLPSVPGFPSYPGTQGFVPGVANMGGMVTPSPDTFYYPQAPSTGMVYYPQ